MLRDFYGTASSGQNARSLGRRTKHAWPRWIRYFRANTRFTGVPICALPATWLSIRKSLTGWANVFDDFGGFGPATAQTLRESVPLVNVGNGDYVVFHAKANRGEAGVIYVSHEAGGEAESPLIPLAESGEQIHDQWEALGYLGPEIWLLYRFIEDSPTGLLDHNSPLSTQWRSFLKSLGLPI